MSDHQAHYQERFSSIFLEEMERRIRDFSAQVGISAYQEALAQVVRLLRGGKRVRPYMIQLGFESIKPNPAHQAAVDTLGVAMECFHVFCLVHDDIMDRSTSRRGELTVHELMRQHFENAGNSVQSAHVANSQAILIGDVLHAWADELFSSVASLDQRLVQEYARITSEVMIGQMLDVHYTASEIVGMREIERKNRLKTAGYTFIGPVRLGLIVSGADSATLDRYEEVMLRLGTAFQLQDDYLDLFGDSRKTGKAEMKDIEEGQQTFFTAYVHEHASAADKAWFKQRLGLPAAGVAGEVRELLERIGAKGAAQKSIEQDLSFVRSQLQSLEPENLAQWLEVIDYLSQRNA